VFLVSKPDQTLIKIRIIEDILFITRIFDDFSINNPLSFFLYFFSFIVYYYITNRFIYLTLILFLSVVSLVIFLCFVCTSQKCTTLILITSFLSLSIAPVSPYLYVTSRSRKFTSVIY